MTYFRLHIYKLISFISLSVLGMFLGVMLSLRLGKITEAYPLLLISIILLIDGLIITFCKKDLFSDKYKGTISYCAFRVNQMLDFCIGIPLIIYGVITLVRIGISQ